MVKYELVSEQLSEMSRIINEGLRDSKPVIDPYSSTDIKLRPDPKNIPKRSKEILIIAGGPSGRAE